RMSSVSGNSIRAKRHSLTLMTFSPLPSDQRNRLVHGTWSFGEEDPTTLTARHVSRQTLTAKDYFTTIAEIEVVVIQAENLRSRVVTFLIGTPETWHLYKGDDPS